MRILYIPCFTNRNLGGCSVFNTSKVVFRRMLDLDPTLFIYWPLPDGADWDVSAAHAELTHPRIKFVPVRALPGQEDEVFFFPDKIYDLFNVDTGRYLVDLVICDKPRISLWLDATINNHIRAVEGSVPFVDVAQYVASQGRRSKYEAYSEIFDYAQILGWYAHPTIWNSDLDRKVAMMAVRKWAQGRVVQRILDTSCPHIISLLDCDRMDQFKPTRSKAEEEIRIHYGSRFQVGYKFEELFESVEMLYRFGRKVKLVITAPNNKGRTGNEVIKQLNHRKMNYEIIAPCPQDKYYETIANCHIFLWMPRAGGLSRSLREQTYMGQAGVVADSEVNQEMLPKYPFMFSDGPQRLVLLRHLVENYWSDEVQTVVQKYSKLQRDRYDAATKVAALYDWLVQLVLKSRASLPSAVTKLVGECMDKAGWPVKLTYKEFREVVAKNSRIGRDIEVNYTGNNRRQCVAALLGFGYVDEGQAEDPVYVKLVVDGASDAV